jgi:shikimate kinase
MKTTLIASDRNLILTGYTGPNQPFIAGRVAEALKMPFVNLDTQIEQRHGYTVNELREQFGEARLKTVEGEALAEALLRRGALLQINGRALGNAETLERLQMTGHVICLVAALDAVLQRLHLALGARYHSPNERAAAVGMVRAEWGVRGRDDVLELDTTELGADAIVSAVVQRWRELTLR